MGLSAQYRPSDAFSSPESSLLFQQGALPAMVGLAPKPVLRRWSSRSGDKDSKYPCFSKAFWTRASTASMLSASAIPPHSALTETSQTYLWRGITPERRCSPPPCRTASGVPGQPGWYLLRSRPPGQPYPHSGSRPAPSPLSLSGGPPGVATCCDPL